MARKLIIGCGYLGSRVVERWLSAGDEVFATTRSAERAEEFRQRGLTPIVADVSQPLGESLPQADTVLWAVGFDRRAHPEADLQAVRSVYVEGLRNVLAALAPETGRVVFISSTGVFGQSDGDWVTEDSPCEPSSDSGRALLEAEGVLVEHSLGKNATILRLAGIYGPDRVPLQAKLAAGEPLPTVPDGWLNLIHVDDAAAAVQAVEQAARPRPLYLVSDGQPIVRREYYQELARLIDAPEPQFLPPADDSTAAQRSRSDKRIDSRRLREELGYRPQYASFREGLAAIV